MDRMYLVLAIFAPRPFFREVVLIADLDQQVAHVAGVEILQIGDTREGKVELLQVAGDGRCLHARLIARCTVMSHRQSIAIWRVEGHHLVGFGALKCLFQRSAIGD